jgi:peptidyl-prolyl cis-trans isomerase D
MAQKEPKKPSSAPVKGVQQMYDEQKRTTNPILYIFSVAILVIIVVTFVGVPVISKMSGSNRIVFGTYKGKAIDYVPGNFLSDQKDALAEQIKQTGDNTSMEYQVYGVWRGAFDRAVLHTALITESRASGSAVSETRVDEALSRHPRFQENGEFSEKRYLKLSSSERFQMRNHTRDALAYQEYLADFFGLKRSTAEINFIKGLASPERKFRYAIFSFTAFPDPMVAQYGAQEAGKFQRMKLSMISISSSRQDAEKVRTEALDKTKSFEDLAKTHSRDLSADKGGELGWRYYHELEAQVKKAEDLKKIFTLKKGTLGDVVETVSGWAIYRCDEPAEAPDFKDAETLKMVRNYLVTFDKGKIEDYLVEKAKRFKESAQKADFLAVAGKENAATGDTDFFPINFGASFFLKPVSQTNDVLAGAAFREQFFQTAFSLKTDEVSDPIVLRDAVIVLRLLEERKAEEKALETLNLYYPMIARQFQEEDLQRFFMASKELKDDFNEVFSRYFFPDSKKK